MALTNTFISNDWMLRRLFATAAHGLPLARLPEVRWPRPTPVLRDDEAAGEQEHALPRYGSSGS
jgi:hypothetical protein